MIIEEVGTVGLMDKARELIRGRKSEIGKGLDKAEEVVSKKTDGKYDEKVRSAKKKAEDALADDKPGSATDSDGSTDSEQGPDATPPPR